MIKNFNKTIEGQRFEFFQSKKKRNSFKAIFDLQHLYRSSFKETQIK